MAYIRFRSLKTTNIFIRSINVSFYANQTMGYDSSTDTFFLKLCFGTMQSMILDLVTGASIDISNTWNEVLIEFQISFNSS
jgi:hypothetical protein